MAAIQMTAIPKTYHDAITITRELGIQYLWIDSLCIIQDDVKDWEQEAARMASVYENAQVTIAAAWGKNGDSGCFHDSLPSIVIEFHEQTCFKSSKDSTRQLYLNPHPDPRRYVGGASLNSRAWALQEIILSRRTIIFAEDQLYWHCTSRYESENGLESIDDMATAVLSVPSLGLRIRHPDIPTYELYDGWQATMQNYSSRFLTRSSDKLAALAGVTQMFQRVTKDVALAGLWRNYIYRGLLWHVPTGMHGKLDSEAIQALNIPSWSWIKICGLVDMCFAGTEPCVEISSAEVSWTGLALTSTIMNASISGKGKLIRVIDIQNDEDDTCMCGPKHLRFETLSDGPSTYHKVYWMIDECTLEIKERLSCLLIYIDEARDLRCSDPYATRISALIVVAVENSASIDTYRRIGFGTFRKFPRSLFQRRPMVNFTLI
jgi:hypothetical protein